jgi:hypothetical protein
VQNVRFSSHGSFVGENGGTVDQEGVSCDFVTSDDGNDVSYNDVGQLNFDLFSVSNDSDFLRSDSGFVQLSELLILLEIVNGLNTGRDEHSTQNGETFDPSYKG